MSILYGCTTWTLTKCMEKKLNSNYTRILRAILNKSWRQLPSKQQLYCHLPPIRKTIKVRRTKVRRTRHCWRSKDELTSDILRWIPSHGRAKAGRLARSYIQQLCADTWYSHEDLPGTMDDRDRRRERVREIRIGSVTWGWWWLDHKAKDSLHRGVLTARILFSLSLSLSLSCHPSPSIIVLGQSSRPVLHQVLCAD